MNIVLGMLYVVFGYHLALYLDHLLKHKIFSNKYKNTSLKYVIFFILLSLYTILH